MARIICQGLLQSNNVMLPSTMACSVMLVVFVVGVGVSIAVISNDDPQYNFFASRLILPAWQAASSPLLYVLT